MPPSAKSGQSRPVFRITPQPSGLGAAVDGETAGQIGVAEQRAHQPR